MDSRGPSSVSGPSAGIGAPLQHCPRGSVLWVQPICSYLVPCEVERIYTFQGATQYECLWIHDSRKFRSVSDVLLPGAQPLCQLSRPWWLSVVTAIICQVPTLLDADNGLTDITEHTRGTVVILLLKAKKQWGQRLGLNPWLSDPRILAMSHCHLH